MVYSPVFVEVGCQKGEEQHWGHTTISKIDSLNTGVLKEKKLSRQDLPKKKKLKLFPFLCLER
jgi:hypothetical protein